MRMIDADALKEKAFGKRGGLIHTSDIDAMPTVEQQEIIRCKDCEFWQDNNGGYPNMNCRWIDDETPDADDFCSYAERRQKNG